MATPNNINFSANLSASGPSISINGNGSASVVQAGTNVLEETQATSTTTAQISLGSVVTIGYLFVKNMDATNSVRVGLATPVTSGNAVATLQAGEFTFIPTRQTTWYVISLASTPQILAVAVEL